jgi:ABC-type polysaccharide/polyol phosphate transport system ATPase subunit
MSNDIAIRVENLSKIYRLYDRPIDRLKESIHPFRKKYHKDFYALKDVDFEVKKGEIVGIIGKNGSGKSTLLKLITGVLTPSSGDIIVNGKVSALLELGAGFNPEMTGIENIYLNGTIMGYSKEEMDAKLEDILDFADIGDFINQPVKMYSSGMFVRLAFSVQALVEPEMLIVDEALAVGDAAFSFKCIKHMKKLVEKGTTVLLVTHDVQMVRSFCKKVIWIDKGKTRLIGNPIEVTAEYVKELFEKTNESSIKHNSIKKEQAQESKEFAIVSEEKKDLKIWGNRNIKIIDNDILDSNGLSINVVEWGQKIIVKIEAIAIQNIDSQNIGFGFSFRNKNGLDVIVSTTIEEGKKIGPLRKGQKLYISFELQNILSPGEYLLTLQAENRDNLVPEYYNFIEDAKIFKVISKNRIYSLVKPDIIQTIDISESGVK